MNDPNSFGYQDTTAGPGGMERPQPPFGPGPGAANPSIGPKHFSPQEVEVLKQCNHDSFFSRSLPLGASLGVATAVAVQQGYLKPNARFGAIPKVTMAVIMGYFVGKLSYQQACAEKLMALPGSYIGQLLRDRRDGKVGGPEVSHNQAPGTMYGATAGDIYSDAGPGNSLDLDSDRAGQVFSEDLTRPESGASDTPTLAPAPSPSRPVLSYDELRRKNRGDHVDAKQDPYRVDPQSVPIVTRGAMPRPVPPSTNAYGDVLE